jgi:CheY-like chemotaxis protein
VLAVDDEPSIRDFIARVLRQPGYEVTVAADGAEAMRIAETEGPFDLLVTDLMMPGIRGDELSQRLRHGTPDLKVLYVTGFSARLFDERSVLWTDEAFLDKPVTAQALLEAAALLLVGHVPPPRAERVHIPGARVRFDDRLTTTLDTVSMNGGFIQIAERQPVGTCWSVVLELPSESVQVAARIVRCEPQAVTPGAAAPATPAYSVAFTFVDLSSRARTALQREIRAVVDAARG